MEKFSSLLVVIQWVVTATGDNAVIKNGRENVQEINLLVHQ